MTDTFPPLTIEQLPNGNLRLEDPTETSSCYTVIIDLHPAQVRHLAERLGLIVQSGTECPVGKSSAELQRENARLKRNMLRVRENALNLQVDFALHADHRNADLTTEMSQINHLVEMLDMACDGFSDDAPCHTTSRHAAGTEFPSPTRNPITPAPAQLELPA